MADETMFREQALSLPGTVEQKHFERQAFKARRIFASVAADGLTANLLLTPEEQLLKCAVHPTGFRPVDNAWGRKGWTTVILKELSREDLADALALAWTHGTRK